MSTAARGGDSLNFPCEPGPSPMPSGTYYRTQAELFLRLAQASGDPRAAERYRELARDQISKAEKAGTRPADAPAGSPSTDTQRGS